MIEMPHLYRSLISNTENTKNDVVGTLHAG